MVGPVSEQQAEKGTFEQISLALLMIRALDRRWTGTLIIQAASGEREILEFQRGLVCRALVPDQHARLGQLLAEAKVVTTDELESALERGGLLGAALQAESLIDEKTLQRALVLQLLRRTARIFARPPETRWSFTPELTLFEGMPEGVRIDTLRVLWAGLSAHGEMKNWLALTLKRIGESPFQVRPEVNLRRYGFTGDAQRVARLVHDERVTLAQLIGKEVAPEDVVKQIVYLLAITRYLDFSPVGTDSAPPISSGSGEASVGDESSIADDSTMDEVSVTESSPSPDEQPATPANPRRVARIKLRRVAVRPAAPDPPGSGEHRSPPKPSSESAASPPSSDRLARQQDGGTDESPREHLSAEIKSRLGRLSQETPFSLLDVQPAQVRGKSDDELTDVFWGAYERCSRRWHPDNCPSELSDLREGMARIYDAMTAAFVELTESKDRHDVIKEFAEESPSNSVLPPTMRSEGSEPAEDSAAGEPEPPPSGERQVEASKFSPVELHAKALVALSEQRLEEALQLCRAACEADADNPDYLASSVWIRASTEDPDTKLLLLDLDGVLREHPDHVQARFYRGVIRRRLGSDNAAKRDFDRVLELQPGHAGAKAQLAAVTRKKKAGKK